MIRIKIPTLYIFAFLFFSAAVYGQTTVRFSLKDLPKITNQKVGLRGNLPPLDWSKSLVLQKEGQVYSIDVDFPATKKELEFKFVLFTDDKNPTWEGIQNRTLTLKENQVQQKSENRWNVDQIIDISTLGKIDVAGLKEDFELIKTMVLDVHPGTYRYNDQEAILSALAELENKFSSSLTRQEAYLAISKLTAQLKCDHTKAGFNNQGRVMNSIIHYQADKIPFTFRWIGEEMIILLNASQSDLLPRGTKVHSINQIPVIEIRDKLLQYIGADGATDKNRLYKAQVHAYDFRYNAFDIFFPLLYPLESNSLQLKVQLPNKDAMQLVAVSTMTREERASILSERYKTFPENRDAMWRFELLSDSIAMLTLNSFGLYGWKAMTIDYKQFLADAFEKIDQQGIQHLIIDIRDNNGGNDEMADELFSYLAKDPFRFEREGRTRFLQFPESLKPHCRTWGENPWYYNLNPKDRNPTDGYYLFKENFSQKSKKGKRKIFKGKSYLLTSAANTSLAFYTAYRFKYQNIGTVIGQETGGNLNDINGGQILFLNLPNSGIEIDFPVMGGFSIKKQANTGLMPHVNVEYQIQDILQETDLELLEAMKLINKM